MVVYITSPADSVDEVLDLRESIEADLKTRGINQWHGTREHGHTALRTWIDRRTLTAVRDQAGNLVATIGLDGPDRDFWTEDEAHDAALYVYKLMIHSDARGTGLGDALLDWGGQHARRIGADLLRLDCNLHNTALHQYWQNRGFEQVGMREHPNRQSGALFQRPATMATSTAEVILIPDDEMRSYRYAPEDTAATPKV